MTDFLTRNQHFDALLNTSDLRWLLQNTNHLQPHPSVLAAMHSAIDRLEFQFYAPPSGLEELRTGVVRDLGIPDAEALISDGAIAALYHIVKTLLKPGETLLTTDPTWTWPMAYAEAAGAKVRQIPIYGSEWGYRLSPERLAAALTPETRIVYLVDPNNPLGTVATREEMDAIAAVVQKHGAYLIHDCTYRHFANEHHLAALRYPEGTLTTYSFSKWLGLAGLRVGAVVGERTLISRLAAAPPNNLGSSIFAQRAAIAGLAVQEEWLPQVRDNNAVNQARIADAARKIPGLHLPVYPSNGNFLIIECTEAGIRPEALCLAFRERNILIRQGRYHTQEFGHHFVKVSTSVPTAWVDDFAAALPEMVARARTLPVDASLF
jgi:histidinol-phosphate/aromatic aminotransferase/cobyric acid decarboxylase-like protein